MTFTDEDDGDNMTLSDALNNAKVEFDDNLENIMNETTVVTPAVAKTKPPVKKAEPKKAPVKKAAVKAAVKAPVKKAAVKAAVKEAAVKAATPKKARGSRIIPEGHVGITDLAKELKLKGTVVRRKLRDSGLEKPADGWVFKVGSKLLADAKKSIQG